MKQSVSDYPVTGVQHTIAVTALTVATVCVEQFIPKAGSPLESHIKNIKEHIDTCAKSTQKKRLSAGSKRALEYGSQKLAPYIEHNKEDTEAEMFIRWASLVWCAMTFIDDVLAVCPQFTTSNRRSWKKLQESVSDLAFALLAIEGNIDKIGIQIYLQAAYALDGIDFISFEALEAAA